MRSLLSRLLIDKPATRYQHFRSLTHGSFASKLLSGILPEFLRPAEDDLPRMDIRKDRFGHEAIRLLQSIADSHFIAFDFEFSGIAERNRERAGKPTVQERYEETRISVHEYQPLQIGLTLVKIDEAEGRYVLEPYNFDLSPLPLLRERQFTRKWSMNSGAVSFLQRNGFDFGKQMTHGVPYLSLQEETIARNKMTADAKRDDMILKPDDQVLVRHVRDSIATWQSQCIDEQEEFLNIPHGAPRGISPELNAYQRRLVHQIVQNEFPNMRSQGMGHFIQITNPTSEQQASQKSLEEEQRERDLSRAIGFRWIIDGIIGRDLSKIPDDYLLPALSHYSSRGSAEQSAKALTQELSHKLHNRRKVLIGHNCLTDVMFLYRMAVGDLPTSVDDFRDRVHDMFPAIIDTKFVSNCFSEKYGRLSLGEVERDLALETDTPVLYTPREFDRYANQAYLHEAGYDSYITAKVAIQMSSKLQKNGSARKKDHDRQQHAVEQAATTATALPDFGVQDGYVTATESMGTAPEVPNDGLSEPAREKNNELSTTKLEADNQILGNKDLEYKQIGGNDSTQSNASSVIAVKQTVNDPTSRRRRSIDWKDESAVAKVKSAFASTSIYDALGSNDNTMPGEANSERDSAEEAKETTQTRMDRLVKEGKMMPRWHEEGPFWEIYGNKLQVNGTQEGVLKLMD